MTSSRTALLLLALGVAAGLAIWSFSSWLTGQSEPWDADLPIWPFSWLLLAMIGGLLGDMRGALLPLGYALGQMLITLPAVSRGAFGSLGCGVSRAACGSAGMPDAC